MSQLAHQVDGREVGFQVGERGVIPDRPSVILIHGSGGSAEFWTLQLGPLDEYFNTVAVELPGHGRTTGPPPETVAGYSSWVERVIKAWNLPRPLVVAGLSLGGAIVLELGLTYPDNLDGLVPAGTGAHLPVNDLIFDGLENDFSGSIRMILKWSFTKNVSMKLIDNGFQQMIRNKPQLVANDFRACSRFDRRNDLHRITLPTLVICGRQDKMTPTDLSDELVEHIPGAKKAYIDDAGHMVPVEQPDAFNEAIVDFVNQLS